MSMLSNRPTVPPTRSVVYVTAFIATFFLLEMLYQGCRETTLERLVIDKMTVAPSAKLISLLTPQEGVVAQGHSLLSGTVRLSVLNGCEGTEAVLMLAAAILVFRRNLRSKLWGIFCGGLLIYAVNQARIVALYYCLRFDRPLFAMLHGYIAPLLVIGVAGLYFFYWMAYARPRHAA